MDFSAQYLHYYSLAYKIGTVFCANVAKGVTCRQPARHSKRSPGGRRNVSPPAQERFPGWWRVFAMCSGGVGPCEPGKSTGEALEPVPGCDPASSRREVPAASSLCGRQAGSPHRNETAEIPSRRPCIFPQGSAGRIFLVRPATRPAHKRSPGGGIRSEGNSPGKQNRHRGCFERNAGNAAKSHTGKLFIFRRCRQCPPRTAAGRTGTERSWAAWQAASPPSASGNRWCSGRAASRGRRTA